MNNTTTTTTLTQICDAAAKLDHSDIFGFRKLNAQADVRVAELRIETFGYSAARARKLAKAKAKLARITLNQLG